MNVTNTLLAALGALALASFPARAADSEGLDCGNRVAVEGRSGETLAAYAIDELKSRFPVQELVTRTPWTKTEEKIHYRGVRLKDVLAEHGLDTLEKAEVFADDGFLSEIGMDEIDSYAPIIAFERACLDKDYGEGRCAPGDEFRALTIEDHGPFFLVWPYDELPAQFFPARNHLWVWWVIGIRPQQ